MDLKDFEEIVYEDEYLHIYGWHNGKAIEILKTDDVEKYEDFKQRLYEMYGFGNRFRR